MTDSVQPSGKNEYSKETKLFGLKTTIEYDNIGQVMTITRQLAGRTVRSIFLPQSGDAYVMRIHDNIRYPREPRIKWAPLAIIQMFDLMIGDIVYAKKKTMR